MRLISIKTLKEDYVKFPPDIQEAALDWYTVVKAANWKSLIEIKETYDNSVDKVGNFLVFNLKSYRLIVGYNFEKQIIYYKYFLPHKIYELGKWKDDPQFKK
ncbi:MAG: hypothetical protein AUK48_09980 [Oscillatoriales cyanobacterium CG2_30_44_21]|nr:MAG: hypothetical protein AUK48_09980 [Oscillatoriales cyanobacterium CG2_30_44_21]